MTFELAGFRTVRREDIRLTAGFTARVDAALSVGALEETVTVSGASPSGADRSLRIHAVDTRDAGTAPDESKQLWRDPDADAERADAGKPCRRW